MKLVFAAQSLFVILISTLSFAGCIPFNQAGEHVGETRCIKGKVVFVDRSQAGFVRLSFCGSGDKCGFTALVAETHAENISSLIELQGSVVKIRGLLENSNGGAQMVLRDSRQLLSDDSGVPSFMKSYDVEERGQYGAGTSHAPRSKRSTARKQTATLPINVPEDAEE